MKSSGVDGFVDSFDDQELEVPRRSLDQAVAWDKDRDLPLPLFRFIAANVRPDIAKALEVEPAPEADPVPRITELRPELVRKVVKYRLESGNQNKRIAIVGIGRLSPHDLIAHVREGTPVGLRWIALDTRNIDVIERLAERGKIRVMQDSPR